MTFQFRLVPHIMYIKIVWCNGKLKSFFFPVEVLVYLNSLRLFLRLIIVQSSYACSTEIGYEIQWGIQNKV